MGQIPAVYLQYFDDMVPGAILAVSGAKDPDKLKQAAKDYIDQTGQLEFNPEYTSIKKLYPFKDLI